MDAELDVLFMTLPLEDLQEKYGKLYERYQELRKEVEVDTQLIYDLRRSLDTATNAETYLSQELEQMALTLKLFQQNAENNTKAQTELEELRQLHHTLSTDFANLQSSYEALEEKNADLLKQLETARTGQEQTGCTANEMTEEQIKRLNALERENMELIEKLKGVQEDNVHHIMSLAEQERNIEILRDQVTCLEGNLCAKREDLEEKTNLLESTQEQLAEANAKLALLSSTPDGFDRKGNSLFAEVDDQRQAMKSLLASQKKNYNEMKKAFNDSQSEIRRLKRENIAMHTELRECCSIFTNADRTYQDKLNERIRHLLFQVNSLEKQLNLTQNQLRDLGRDKDVAWLDSMMNFCKQETDELKKQLHGLRIQKASLEETLRNVNQDMARWRFESLKSRCVLLDRENLLNEHGILFSPVNASEFRISRKEEETARPRIVYDSANSSTKPNICEPIPGKNADNETPATAAKQSQPVLVTETDDEKGNSEQLLKSNGTKEAFIREKNQLKSPVLERKLKNNLIDNELSTKMDLKPFQFNKKIPPDANVMPGPSILTNNREPFTKDQCGKNVQFSAQEPIIHNISANASINSESDIAQNEEIQAKTKIIQKRATSSIIVRRVVVASKR